MSDKKTLWIKGDWDWHSGDRAIHELDEAAYEYGEKVAARKHLREKINRLLGRA